MAQSNHEEDATRAGLTRDKLRTPPILSSGGSGAEVKPGSAGQAVLLHRPHPQPQKKQKKVLSAVKNAFDRVRRGNEDVHDSMDIESVTGTLFEGVIAIKKGSKHHVLVGQYRPDESEAVIGVREHDGDILDLPARPISLEVVFKAGTTSDFFVDGGLIEYGGEQSNYDLFGEQVNDAGVLRVTKIHGKNRRTKIEGEGQDRYGFYKITGHARDGVPDILRHRLPNTSEHVFQSGSLVYGTFWGTDDYQYPGVVSKNDSFGDETKTLDREGFVTVNYLDGTVDSVLSTMHIRPATEEEIETLAPGFRQVEERLFPQPFEGMRVCVVSKEMEELGEGTVREVNTSRENTPSGSTVVDIEVLLDVDGTVRNFFYPSESMPLRDKEGEIEWEQNVAMDDGEEDDNASAGSEEEDDEEEEYDEEEKEAEEEKDDGEEGIATQMGDVTIDDNERKPKTKATKAKAKAAKPKAQKASKAKAAKAQTGRKADNEAAAARETDPIKADLIRNKCPDELVFVGKKVVEAAKKAEEEVERMAKQKASETSDDYDDVLKLERSLFYGTDSKALRDLVKVQMEANVVMHAHAKVSALSYLVDLCKILGIKAYYKDSLDAEIKDMIATAGAGTEEDAVKALAGGLKEKTAEVEALKERIAELEAEKETWKETEKEKETMEENV